MSNPPVDADRFGVFLSVLCAIHCAVTPPLLLLMPTFGRAWAHPATHWGMALFVVPIAVLMMSKGYKRHRRQWIIGIGVLGILFVLAGTAAPYFEQAPVTTKGCADACCPSMITDADGDSSLHIPLASIFTTIGGLFLIGTHLGNLCLCPCCNKKK